MPVVPPLLELPVAEIARDRERDCIVLDGALELGVRVVASGEISLPVALALPVADLLAYQYRLPVALDGLLVLAELLVGDAQVALPAALDLLVAKPAADLEREQKVLLMRALRRVAAAAGPGAGA